MTEWLVWIGQLPTAPLVAALGLVMILDAIPLIGVLVPGDVAVLTAFGATGPLAGAGAFLAAIGGSVAGWSVSFFAGRVFGERLRHSRVGQWIGAARWAAAEEILGRGGHWVIVAAPFLPVLNAVLPLAAGGLRMSYRRFAYCAALGSALWVGLYLVVGATGRLLGALLPNQTFTTAVTLGIGLVLGWIVLLTAGRRLAVGAATKPATASRPAPARDGG